MLHRQMTGRSESPLENFQSTSQDDEIQGVQRWINRAP